MLQFVGFLKEYDKNVRNARTMENMFMDRENEGVAVQAVLSYLDRGKLVTGVLTTIYDDNSLLIGNLDYFTDGEYIWPFYYRYYVNKYSNFYLDAGLKEKALANIKGLISVDDKRLLEIEKDFIKEWSGKY